MEAAAAVVDAMLAFTIALLRSSRFQKEACSAARKSALHTDAALGLADCAGTAALPWPPSPQAN